MRWSREESEVTLLSRRLTVRKRDSDISILDFFFLFNARYNFMLHTRFNDSFNEHMRASSLFFHSCGPKLEQGRDTNSVTDKRHETFAISYKPTALLPTRNKIYSWIYKLQYNASIHEQNLLPTPELIKYAIVFSCIVLNFESLFFIHCEWLK